MNRRDVITSLFKWPVMIAATSAVASVTILGSHAALGCDVNEEDAQLDGVPGMKSFAYYEGLGPNERRSSRTDGTYYKMPCISKADVEAAVDKEYLFWHDHDGQQHHFLLTSEHFKKIALGEAVETFTTVVQGHRHALRIEPKSSCS